jgi:TatD DNase family protein
VSFPKAENIRETAKQVPADHMLIETDSPYLAPVPHRGKRNEPSFVVNTAEAIAQLRGVSGAEIGLQTARNFYSLFPSAQ